MPNWCQQIQVSSKSLRNCAYKLKNAIWSNGIPVQNNDILFSLSFADDRDPGSRTRMINKYKNWGYRLVSRKQTTW